MDTKSQAGDTRSALNQFISRNKTMDGTSVFDGRSSNNISYISSASTKKSKMSTLTKEQLQSFFKEKHQKLEDDVKSRISQISKG